MRNVRFRTKRIKITNHAKRRMSERNITESLVITVIRNPEDVLYDTDTGREVLIDYNHGIAIICEELTDIVIVVTVVFSKNLKKVGGEKN